jgi:hypothetical protein
MQVRIICSENSVAFHGAWKGEDPQQVIDYVKEKAVEFNMPVQLEIAGHGSYSFTPEGRVTRGRLFKSEKSKSRR